MDFDCTSNKGDPKSDDWNYNAFVVMADEKRAIEGELAALRQQRDELLVALLVAEPLVLSGEANRIWRNSYGVTPGDVERELNAHPTQELKTIRDAIAKAEGK